MTRALIVIDVQESFRQLPSWGEVSDPDIAATVASVVEYARGRGDQVVWILHNEPGSGGPFDPVSGAVTLLPGLVAAADELTLLKTSHNAFTTTALQQHLVSHGVDEVAVVGIRTEQCCETTARLASDLGYRVDFVADATATHPLPLADGSKTLTTDEVIERTTAALADRFARITTVAEVLAS